MKQIYSLTMLFALLTLISLAGCAMMVDTNSKCGDDKSKSINAVDQNLILLGTYQSSRGDAFYLYSLDMTEVCTFEHAKYTVEVLGKRGVNASNFDVSAGASWAPFFGESFVLDYTGSVWSKSSQVGLKQIYNDGPGEYSAYCIISFVTTGTQATDDVYLLTYIKSVKVQATYKAHKSD
jgi:hypothetical protein